MLASAEVEAMDGHQAEGHEENQKNDREVLDVTVVKLWCKLDHSYLPSQAAEPDKCEDQGDSVQLVMDQLVVLVNLEYERVVNAEAAEYLNAETRGEEDEAND